MFILLHFTLHPIPYITYIILIYIYIYHISYIYIYIYHTHIYIYIYIYIYYVNIVSSSHFIPIPPRRNGAVRDALRQRQRVAARTALARRLRGLGRLVREVRGRLGLGVRGEKPRKMGDFMGKSLESATNMGISWNKNPWKAQENQQK